MSGHQIRLVRGALLLSFFIIPNFCAFLMVRSSSDADRQLRVLNSSGSYSKTAPFVGSAELVSPSGLTLLSRQRRTACLAAYTKVSQVIERESKSSSDRDKTRSQWKKVAEYWDQVDDFRVRISSQDLPLRLRDVSEFYEPFDETLREPPSYVERDRIPYSSARLTHYVVGESVFLPGQNVFIAAQVSPEGRLEAHPGLGTLLLFPGSQEACLEHFHRLSRGLRWASYALVAFSLLSCLGIWALFRKLEKKTS